MDVAVLGAGALGRDLAQLLAAGGCGVSLHDADASAVMDAVDVIGRRLDAGDAAERVDGTTDRNAAVADAAVVFETDDGSPEQLRERLAGVEEALDRDAVIVVAETDGGITVVAAGLRHPDRAVGVCLPDPLNAHIAELVVADQTAAAALERVEGLFEQLDIPTAVVRDHPGIVSTRLALAAEVEAMRAYADGLGSVSDVDAAFAKRYGHPVGPLERADRAGLDHRLEILESLADTLGERFAPPQLLRELVADGQIGQSSGAGFYDWSDGDPAGPALPDPALIDRAVGPDDPDQG